jgi:hypothetical protein
VSATLIPILPSKSFDETARFYAALGFTETGRWPGEYLILQHGRRRSWFRVMTQGFGFVARRASAGILRRISSSRNAATEPKTKSEPGTNFGSGVLELHFWSNPTVDRKTNDVACYIRFDSAAEARALHDAWAPNVAPGARLDAPVETDYGLTEFALIDPHGNLLRVGGRTNA